jgi:hypothetical protein
LAANVGTTWNGAKPSPCHSKIVEVVANWYGPAPLLILATARNARSPIVKNSASSPPGAGSVAQQQAGVAIAAVHPWWGPGNVDGELGDGEKVTASHPDRLHGPRARGGKPLDLGEGDCHPTTTAIGIPVGK